MGLFAIISTKLLTSPPQMRQKGDRYEKTFSLFSDSFYAHGNLACGGLCGN